MRWNANLSGADLEGASLRGALVSFAKFSGAKLAGLNLSGLDLFGADLSDTDLSGADLTKTNLCRTNFTGADLTGAILDGATLSETVLGNTTIKNIAGLDKLDIIGPCTIDFRTIGKSWPIPLSVLRGCGLSNKVIEQIPSLIEVSPQFYSCFISYSHTDALFARTLYDALQERDIRCWLDEHQILPGDDVRDRINQGISIWDKVLLCCSEVSLGSYWVNTEVDKALKKEEGLWKSRGRKVLALIPINLDNFLFSWESSRASVLTDRHAEDLVGWETDWDKFQRALERIKRALRVDEFARGVPPRPLL